MTASAMRKEEAALPDEATDVCRAVFAARWSEVIIASAVTEATRTALVMSAKPSQASAIAF
jgi:hypothetical protein